MPSDQEIRAAKVDEAALENIIREDKSFILSCAGSAAGRFVTDSDNEWSVALNAYYEAVKSYDEDKGSFHTFAGLVIKRRILDYLQSEYRRKDEILIAPDTFEGNLKDEPDPVDVSVYDAEAALSFQSESQNALREEIEALSQELAKYDISFFELTEVSPKAEKTKKACAKVIKKILENDALRQSVLSSGRLPGSRLIQTGFISRKIIENHRKYIIAAIVILNGDYPLVGDYLSFIRKEGET